MWWKRFFVFVQSNKRFIYLILFLIAFIPRVLALNSYVAPDEAKWILRSAHFLTALHTGDFGAAASQIATPEVAVLAPAVTTMWTGALGLLAKYQADGASIPLVDYLADLPYNHSEKMPLDFYPWLRFPTVVITSLFIVVFYILLLNLLANEKIALIAAILLALDPFFVNYSRVIHHDALVTVFMTLTLLSAMLYLQQENIRWLLLSGVMLGLAVLTKPTALFLIPFIGLMWLWRTYRTRQWQSFGWGILWAGIGLFTFVIIWPALWRDPTGTIARLIETSLIGATGDSKQTLIPALIPNRLPELGVLFYPVNFLLSWGILPTLGLAILLFTWWRGKEAESNRVKSVLTWLLLFSFLLILTLIPLGTRDIRYYMPAWPTLITVAAVGLTQFTNQIKPGAIVVLSIVLLLPYYPYYISYYNPIFLGPYLAPKLIKLGGGVGLDQAASHLNTQPNIKDKRVASYILESFHPYFSGNVSTHKSDDYADFVVNYIRQIQNHHPSAEHIAYFDARKPDRTIRINGIDYAYIHLIPTPRLVHNVSFDDITLVAQTLDARFAEPGREHQLTLLWRASPAVETTSVRLQIRDHLTDKIWDESQGRLLSPDGPSEVEGRYTLTIPSDMPRGDYELWVTVGNNNNWVKFANLPVYQLSPPKTIPYPTNSNFNNFMLLHGFDVSNTTPVPGETLTLNLYWQALQQMPHSYTTFIHLIDSDNSVVAQADVTPGNGAAPTDTWQTKEWVLDNISLPLPSDLPTGDYQLLVGWYYWKTGERLPLLDNNEGRDILPLTSITVKN